METLLLIVTGVSLTAALVLGWTAWRLSRRERERAVARVAALAAAATEPAITTAAVVRRQAKSSATTTSPYADFADEAVPLAQVQPGSRIAARHAAAAQDIEWAPPRPEELPLRPEPAAPAAVGRVFAGAPRDPSNGGQLMLALAAFVLLMALGAAGAWLYLSAPPAAAPVVSAGSSTPLELISLRHERSGDRLSVIGMVRNPAAGVAVDALSATVLLFDQQGGYLTSGRDQVDVPQLRPGEESPFTLSVVAPTGAARYRVSFKSDERLVPHVDRRAAAPAGSASALPGR